MVSNPWTTRIYSVISVLSMARKKGVVVVKCFALRRLKSRVRACVNVGLYVCQQQNRKLRVYRLAIAAGVSAAPPTQRAACAAESLHCAVCLTFSFTASSFFADQTIHAGCVFYAIVSYARGRHTLCFVEMHLHNFDCPGSSLLCKALASCSENENLKSGKGNNFQDLPKYKLRVKPEAKRVFENHGDINVGKQRETFVN